ncbi:MAG: hypothetical protein LBC97_03570 [Bifidobacteriaceae bacterium]|nr:hypothetical protein [Bifidobacteriaceae bacterium]
MLAELRRRSGDSIAVEVERAGDGVPRLAETRCAFGNMPSGGAIVLGISGSEVLVVTVAGLPAADKPCRCRGKAYLRQADGDYVMSEQEIAQLVALQDRPQHDAAVIAGLSPADLDGELVERFLDEARASSRSLAGRADGEVLRLKGVAAPGGLTLAGLYSMGSYPQQFAPS